MTRHSIPDESGLTGFIRRQAHVVGSDHRRPTVIPGGSVIRLHQRVLSLQIVFRAERGAGEEEEAAEGAGGGATIVAAATADEGANPDEIRRQR